MFEWFDESAITDTYFASRKSFSTSRRAKGANTLTTILSHFVLAHVNFFENKFLMMLDVQSTDLNEWLCFKVWKAINPSCAARTFLSSSASCDVIQEVSLWLSLFAAAASLCFFFAICCVMSERPPCYIEKWALHTVHNTLPLSLSARNGYSSFSMSVKVHLRLGILASVNTLSRISNYVWYTKALCRPQLYHNHISRRHTVSTFKHTDNAWRNENTKEVSQEPEVSNLCVTFGYRSTEGYRISKHGVYYGVICSKNMKLFYKNFEIIPNEDSTVGFKNTYKLYYVTTSQKRDAFFKKGEFCVPFAFFSGHRTTFRKKGQSR